MRDQKAAFPLQQFPRSAVTDRSAKFLRAVCFDGFLDVLDPVVSRPVKLETPKEDRRFAIVSGDSARSFIVPDELEDVRAIELID